MKLPQHKSKRNQLINLIKQGKKRVKFTKERPHEWTPYKVRNPNGDIYFQEFTEIAAWELIVELLENGHPIEEKTLRKPPGAKGYEIKVKLEPNKPKLYIKLELGKMVFGRSFHYSDRN